MLAIPPVIPLLHADLHLSETQIGWLSSLPPMLFAIAAVPGSLLIARVGLIPALLVGLSIALVLALELANSAIEYVIDHLHPEIAPQIKLAKDVIAGAVLVACFGSLCVGGLMMLAVLLR